MPYANEIPGHGGAVNTSRRRGEKHALIFGAIAGPSAAVTVTLIKANAISAGLVFELIGSLILGAIIGSYMSLMIMSPILGFFYQWRLIRYREKSGIPHPSPHSHGGDKWLELDDDDPLRDQVDARLKAAMRNNKFPDRTEDWPDILR